MSSHGSRTSGLVRAAWVGVVVLLASCRHAVSVAAPASTPANAAPPPYRAWQDPPCPNGAWRAWRSPSEFRADPALATTIEGRLVGSPLPLVTADPPVRGTVSLEDLHRGAFTDSTGWFQFRDVPSGRHVLLSRALGFARRVDTLTVTTPYGWHLRLVMPLACQWPM
jgi:hypothetical protein